MAKAQSKNSGKKANEYKQEHSRTTRKKVKGIGGEEWEKGGEGMFARCPVCKETIGNRGVALLKSSLASPRGKKND
jgi:hypothetical protein